MAAIGPGLLGFALVAVLFLLAVAAETFGEDSRRYGPHDRPVVGPIEHHD